MEYNVIVCFQNYPAKKFHKAAKSCACSGLHSDRECGCYGDDSVGDEGVPVGVWERTRPDRGGRQVRGR